MSDHTTEETRFDLERRVLYAFGQLEGRLSYASPALLRRFAFASLREILVRNLEDAGFLDTSLVFDRWLAGGPPPQSGPSSEAPAEAVAAVILRYLTQANWPDLAEAAELLSRAAPHLTRGDGAQTLEPVIDEARLLVAAAVSKDGAREGDPVCLLGKIAGQARMHPAFVHGRREELPIDIEGTQYLIPRGAQRAASWAINLTLGEGLVAARVLPLCLPLFRAITPEALRPDLTQGQRTLALARSGLKSVDRTLALLNRSRQRCKSVGPLLAAFRSVARAPLVQLVLSEFGPMSVAQLMRTLGVTRRGMMSMLQPLERSGLVEKVGLLWHSKVPLTAIEDVDKPPLGASLASAAREVDVAMARVDRLLQGIART